MQDIISTIKQVISDKGLKQKFVAEQIGMTPQEFSNILNGRKKLEVQYVAPVCRALNISANDLFGISS